MGAGLETAGQVRGAYPFLASEMIAVTVQWSSGDARASIVPATKPPFNRGPDRSGRVYAAVNGFHYLLDADSFVATPTAFGTLRYRDSGGSFILATVYNVLSAVVSYNAPDTRLSPFLPHFSENLDKLGELEFVNIGSALNGTATFIRFRCFLNIGYYGDYETSEFLSPQEMRQNHTDIMTRLRNIAGDYS